MKHCSIFLLFSSVFLFSNFNVEATSGALPSTANDLINVMTNNVDSIKIPIKYPLPPIGTTACSTYKHADMGIENFQRLCYTQLFLQQNTITTYKCRTNQFFVGAPVAKVPFDIPTPVDFTPQAGYSINTYVLKSNTSSKLIYNSTFVEVQKAEPLFYVVSGTNLTLAYDSVITHYTKKGYVQVVCPLVDLNQPLCVSPNYVSVCTYAQPYNADDVKALADPLNGYPYYLGNDLIAMDQTGC